MFSIQYLPPADTVVKQNGKQISKHPDKKANRCLLVNPAKIHLIHWCGSLYCS